MQGSWAWVSPSWDGPSADAVSVQHGFLGSRDCNGSWEMGKSDGQWVVGPALSAGRRAPCPQGTSSKAYVSSLPCTFSPWLSPAPLWVQFKAWFFFDLLALGEGRGGRQVVLDPIRCTYKAETALRWFLPRHQPVRAQAPGPKSNPRGT